MLHSEGKRTLSEVTGTVTDFFWCTGGEERREESQGVRHGGEEERKWTKKEVKDCVQQGKHSSSFLKVFFIRHLTLQTYKEMSIHSKMYILSLVDESVSQVIIIFFCPLQHSNSFSSLPVWWVQLVQESTIKCIRFSTGWVLLKWHQWCVFWTLIDPNSHFIEPPMSSRRLPLLSPCLFLLRDLSRVHFSPPTSHPPSVETSHVVCSLFLFIFSSLYFGPKLFLSLLFKGKQQRKAQQIILSGTDFWLLCILFFYSLTFWLFFFACLIIPITTHPPAPPPPEHPERHAFLPFFAPKPKHQLTIWIAQHFVTCDCTSPLSSVHLRRLTLERFLPHS